MLHNQQEPIRQMPSARDAEYQSDAMNWLLDQFEEIWQRYHPTLTDQGK